MMVMRPEKWPTVSNELLPKVLFNLAAQYPDSTYAVYPHSDNVEDGFHEIKFREVANAVHAMAWWLEKNVGKPAEVDGSQTLVYMGPNDLRYGILVLSSVMVGYKMLFPSPRYGVESISKLVSLANGCVMLLSSDPDPIISEVATKRSMRTLEVPSVEHFLASTPDLYPYTKTFATSKDEPLVCVHTSGTTGFPKPIIWTHDWINSSATGHRLPVSPGYELSGEDIFGSQKSIMGLFPRMHSSGVICAVILPLCLGVTMVHPPSRAAPNEAVDAAIEAIEFLGDKMNISALALPPPHMMYLATNSAMLETLRKRVRSIGWAGGAIPDAIVRALPADLQFDNFLASTEMGVWPGIHKVSSPEDTHDLPNEPQYFTFHPALNIRFDALSEGEEGTLYEAKMVKNKGENAWIQPIFKILTNVDETSLDDLFVRHPHDPHKWKHAGRSDDMLAFMTPHGSEKYYPAAAERQINAHPGVAEAIIVGNGRARASLIVRFNDGADVDSIWELIEKINQSAPVYARIAKYMVLAATAPFPKTAKGSVQKMGTLMVYEKEMNALYEADGKFV